MNLNIGVVVMLIQVFFAIVIGLYFWNLLRNQKNKPDSGRQRIKERDG